MIETSRINRLAREAAWVVTGQVAAVLGALVTVRVLTELLSPSAYGELALVMTITLLVTQVAFGPLSQGAIRFFIVASEADDKPEYRRAVFRLMSLASLCILGLTVAGVIVGISGGHYMWSALGAIAVILSIVGGYNAVYRGIQNAARRRLNVAIHQAAEPWAKIAFAAIILIAFGGGSFSALLGYAIGASFVLASQHITLRRILPSPGEQSGRDIEWRNRILAYAWPFGAWGIFYWAQRASDRWALALFDGSESVGLYAVIFQLGYYPMALATESGMRFIAPILFERAGDATDSNRIRRMRSLSRKLTVLSLIGTVLTALLVFLLREKIVLVFLGEQFRQHSMLLPVMVLNGGLFASAQTVALSLMGEMRMRSMFISKIVTALLGVGANFLGAYLFGVGGVAYAGLAVSVIFFSWMVIAAQTQNQLNSVSK